MNATMKANDLYTRLVTLQAQRSSLLDEAKRTVDAKSREGRLRFANLVRAQIERVWDQLDKCKGE
jgi:hypothetical protein